MFINLPWNLKVKHHQINHYLAHASYSLFWKKTIHTFLCEVKVKKNNLCLNKMSTGISSDWSPRQHWAGCFWLMLDLQFDQLTRLFISFYMQDLFDPSVYKNFLKCNQHFVIMFLMSQMLICFRMGTKLTSSGHNEKLSLSMIQKC